MTIEIVIGSPGCGKTTALLNIVDEELTRGVSPDRIAFISFTRKAAEEAISRAVEKFNLSRSDLPHFRTIHSLCFRSLGLRSADVLERDRLKEFAEYAGVRITGRWSEDGTFAGYELGDRCLHMENMARVRGLTLRQQYQLDSDNLPWSTVEHVATCLRAFKEAHGLMDFTDMLSAFIREDRSPKLEVFLLDESQDCSNLQWRVAELLGREARRIVVAGDDDQAIFRWAGADVDYLVDLPGRVTVLGQSWRVPSKVQSLALSVIERVHKRRPKVWASRDAEGSVNRVPSLRDADLTGEDILILARNQYLITDQIEPELRRRGIVYEANGRPSVKSSVLRAVSAWERLRGGTAVDAGEVKLVYDLLSTGPSGVLRGFKKKLDEADVDLQLTLTDLRGGWGLVAPDVVWHEALDRLPQEEMSYLLAARRAGEKLLAKPRVRVSTIHGAKGGEADSVIVHNELARRTFVEYQKNEDDENRVFYVACTRAREKLTIVDSASKLYYPHL